MAKGKKGKKAAADDDWENDVPTIDDINNAATAGEPEANGDSKAPQMASADDFADEFGGGGGLLGAIKKNAAKKKKGKGGANNKNDDDMAAALAALTTGGDAETPAGEAAPATEDDFAPADKKGKGNNINKKAAGGASPAPEANGDDDDEEKDASGKVMTKKEKEKAKKEREKQRKKEQAARKKTTEPTKIATPAPAAAAAAEAAPMESKPTAEPAGAKKPTKKLNPQLLALQRQQEERRQREEEARQMEEEARLEAEEEEKKIAEEEAKKAEQKARKKEAEKAKKEQLKKEGKLLTKAQKEAKAKAELRLKQMEEQGIVVQGLADPSAAKKKPVYDKKKKKPAGKSKEELEAAEAEQKEAEAKKQKEEEEKLAAEKLVKEEEEEEKKAAEAKPAEEDDVIESWEDAIDEDGNIKESWDMESDAEDDAPGESSQPKTVTKPTRGATNSATNGKSTKAPPKKFDDEDESSDESSEDEEQTVQQQMLQKKKDEAAERRKKQHEEALAARSKDNLRSPICCILGHVDTGKTKLLDKIRQTNVQEGEAGGITQQIGATYFPVDAIKAKTQVVNQDGSFEFKVPGLLVIDTPGHESFTNLRSRGSSLCNIAILVVDIMHGLEPQTLESIRLLKDRKTPFIVALNKIDRLYSWKPVPDNGFRDSLSKQNKAVQAEFKDRLERTKLAFAEQGLNSELFYDNKAPARTVSLVPTSAHTGEGIPDMLKLLITLTQTRMTDKLMYLSELECTVLEVKVIEGLGTTIDVVLSNGILREGDRIVMCGLNGAISTNIRALLTPQPLKELRIKGSYVHHKEVKAALGIKIAANDMEDAIAGSRLMVVGPDDDEDDIEEEVMGDLEGLLTKVTKGDKGVSVQASTLGSLEALLEFLRVSKIPVMSISIGPVYKRDVMRAGAMLEKHKEFAVMLCFDVKIDKEAQAYADEVGVKLFTADIIYHLFDSFTAYQKDLLEQKKKETADLAVFPCVLQIAAVFHQRDPIVVGVDVIEGTLRHGTPIAVMKPGTPEPVLLGRVTSIELNHKQIPTAKKGSPSVAVKIEASNQPTYGRHWDDKDTLYSHISRKSIDVVKTHFRDDLSKEEWQLMVSLKKVFKID